MFALNGAAAGVKQRLDLFGVLVLSFAAASVGDMLRDLLIGAVTPAAIRDWRYLGVSLLAGLVLFFGSLNFSRFVARKYWLKCQVVLHRLRANCVQIRRVS